MQMPVIKPVRQNCQACYVACWLHDRAMPCSTSVKPFDGNIMLYGPSACSCTWPTWYVSIAGAYFCLIVMLSSRQSATCAWSRTLFFILSPFQSVCSANTSFPSDCPWSGLICPSKRHLVSWLWPAIVSGVCFRNVHILIAVELAASE